MQQILSLNSVFRQGKKKKVVAWCQRQPQEFYKEEFLWQKHNSSRVETPAFQDIIEKRLYFIFFLIKIAFYKYLINS